MANKKNKRRRIFIQQGGKCLKCGIDCVMPIPGHKQPENIFTLDHIISPKKGGDDSIFNLQGLCFNCNFKKGSKVESYNANKPETDFEKKLNKIIFIQEVLALALTVNIILSIYKL